MALSLYKSGQGYWTRTLSAVGAAVLVLSGTAWLWNELEVIRSVPAIYVQSSVAVGLIVVFAGLTWWLLNKPKVADFMIATEQEMKKVNWPTRRELFGSTIVVIAGTFLMALLLYVFDIFFLWFFSVLNIIKI